MAGEIMEMTEKTAPSAAITEKRANRLGGCVGIFFQLFDWNRRFAKKKLFSRQSLLPGKQASKRFGGNEKMPKSKLSLIADENRGGFPKRSEVGETKKHEMRSPGLVARLMGLESMPSIHRDKPKKKSSMSQIDNKSAQEEEMHNNKCNVISSSSSGREEDSGFEKSRPQKIQKTAGVCDRRVVKKFGSEALQIKNVLTHVRKHHQHKTQHQKIVPSVRSPRLHRKSSRLIDAAARILEPGLQAKRGTRCAIAYPSSRRCENVGTDPVGAVCPDSLEFQDSDNLASCRNCGSFVDVTGSGEVFAGEGSNRGQASEPSSFCLNEGNVAWRNQEPCVFAATKGTRSDYLTDVGKAERKASRRESHDFNVKQQRQHHKDKIVSLGSRNRNNYQDQLLQRERFPPHTSQSKRFCSSPEIAVKDKAECFSPAAHGSTSKTRAGLLSKTENSELKFQRKPHTRFEESSVSGLSTPARKRRVACGSEQSQGPGFAFQTSRRSNLDFTGDCSSTSGRRESEFVPLKFGSPRKAHSRSCREAKEREGIRPISDQTVQRYSNRLYPERLPPDADTVRLLLHQKLKEMASQHEDDTRRGCKSTSVILQELISSLALERPVIGAADAPCAEKACRKEGKTEAGSSRGYAHYSDYTSPGSVLDASFSNESCFSSSLDNHSVQIRLPLEPTELDLDLFEDSATSIKKSMTSNFVAIANLINHVSHVLHGLRRMGLISTQSRFNNARDVIIQTELLFGTREDFLICPRFLDELMIQAARSKNVIKLTGLTGGFLVDALIEYLELRYCRDIFLGLEQWRTFPLCVDSDELIPDVLEEVTKWTEMTGMYLEEMDKWQDLETHVSEIGTEIAWEILCCLVGELTADLGK